MNIYRALQEELRPFADGAIKYLKNEFGVSSLKIEEELSAKIDFRPTLHGLLPDKHLVCVEVCDTLFPPLLERFILGCRNAGLPIKLFIALPKGQINTIETRSLSFAQENGIAILEIAENGSGKLIHGLPLSLSLGGLRSFDLAEFPRKYRAAIGSAITTFKQGNPEKGCAQIYDESEALTRRVLHRCKKIRKGLTKKPEFNIDKEAWANSLEFLKANVNKARVKCPDLTPSLINRLIAATPHRNDAGHKPNSLEKLIQRDTQLRTRFESAVDDLQALIRAAQPLHV
ncbi:MAG TPA: hypothetical protein VF943_10740 [Burkholderiales bacterium]